MDSGPGKLLAIALVFSLMCSTILGLLVINAGIIARQRACVFPCIFLFVEAMPARPKRPIRAPAPTLLSDLPFPRVCYATRFTAGG